MKILIADDNHFYRCALKTTLTDLGYDVVAVPDGEAAWEVLQGEHAPKLAILDWVMPKLDGLGVCRRLRELPSREPTYVIMLTSKNGLESAVTALESGADDYIEKPFDRELLRARLRVGRRIVGLQTSETIVYSFARSVEAKSAFTKGHSDRVSSYVLAMAANLGLNAADRDVLRRGAVLHDIGKICVPDSILNKPSALTAEEFEIISQHPMQGVKMIEPLESVHDVIPLVRWHHERLDGAGYPDRLKGDQIPLLVRILSVADVYDALRSDRPYRPGMPHSECLTTLRRNADEGGLDRELVEQFCKLKLDAQSGTIRRETRPLASAVSESREHEPLRIG